MLRSLSSATVVVVTGTSAAPLPDVPVAIFAWFERERFVFGKTKTEKLAKKKQKVGKSKTFSEKLEKTKVCCYVASGSHVATGFARASPDAASLLAGLRHGSSPFVAAAASPSLRL